MRTQGASNWTPAMEETLRVHWEINGFTAAEIASRMGLVSRNAVIGKVRRLGLSFRTYHRTTPSRPKAPPKPRKSRAGPPKPTRTFKPLPILVEPSPGDQRRLAGLAWEAAPGAPPVSLIDLEAGMCKWPIGETKPFLFCGHPATAGVYCQQHHDWSVGNGSSLERAAIKFAVDANKDEWRQGAAARERSYPRYSHKSPETVA